jgi:hypothetical protein
MSRARVRLILNLAGLVVLLAGYTTAALIWRAQSRVDQANADLAANPAAPVPPLDSKKDARQIEVEYGKSGVLMESFMEWAGSLTHGKNLAKIIIVASSVAAIGCFFMAGRRRPRPG